MYVDETYYNDVFKGEPVESADFPLYVSEQEKSLKR